AGPLPVRPARRAPPPLVVVAAGRDERLVGSVADRGGVQVEGRNYRGVRGPLVVQRPRLSRGAHGERAAGDEDLGGQADRVRGQPRRGRGQGRGTLPGLVGGQPGLAGLLFVLRDHAEREPVGDQRGSGELGVVQQIEYSAANLPDIGSPLGRRQQRQGGPLRTWVLASVVERGDIRAP